MEGFTPITRIEQLLNQIEENTSGGSDIFVVHFEVTWDETTSSIVVTCDKTAAEIAAAGDAGKLIIGKALMMQTAPERTSFDVVAYTYDGNPQVRFEYITIWPSSEIGSPSSDDLLEHSAIYWNNGWFFGYSDYQLTPKA